MFTGIDVGGTNTDIVIVDREIHAEKVPNRAGLHAVLDKIPVSGRVAVSTSQVLNRILIGPREPVCTIVIPGPGLVYQGAIPGAVNHRGDITEPLGEQALLGTLSSSLTSPVAICGKFSLRNPALEDEAGRLVAESNPGRVAALSHAIGTGSLPARIAATEWNARAMATCNRILSDFQAVRADLLFFRGDGGLSSASVVRQNPLLLLHSSPAAAAAGAVYASGLREGLVADIGGSSTDLVPLADGKPLLAPLSPGGTPLPVWAVISSSLPFGGDSLLAGARLHPRREGPPLAFGGPLPTLTDALNRAGEEIGDPQASRSLDREEAEESIGFFIRSVARVIRESAPPVLIGSGFLAPFLIHRIAREAGVPWVIPPHAPHLNALGVAVSRVSIVYHVHADSERRRFLANGRPIAFEGRWDDEAVLSFAADLVRHDAAAMGAPPSDCGAAHAVIRDSWEMVRSGRRTGKIWEIEASIPPGISMEAP